MDGQPPPGPLRASGGPRALPGLLRGRVSPTVDPDELRALRVLRYRPPPAGTRSPGSDRHTTRGT
jgi:hypothetical protein